MISLLMVKSHNSEVDGTATQIIGGYDATTLKSDATLEVIMNKMKDKSALLSDAIGRLKAKSVQETNDEIRDEKVTGLYYLLLGSLHSPANWL